MLHYPGGARCDMQLPSTVISLGTYIPRSDRLCKHHSAQNKKKSLFPHCFRPSRQRIWGSRGCVTRLLLSIGTLLNLSDIHCMCGRSDLQQRCTVFFHAGSWDRYSLGYLTIRYIVLLSTHTQNCTLSQCTPAKGVADGQEKAQVNL